MELMDPIFERGAFRPESPVELPEGTRDQRVIERMKRNPVPSNSLGFRRDELHERG
jgi:hypothetical protein